MDDSYHSHLRVSLLNLLGPSNPIWSCASAQTHPEATKFRRGIRESVKEKKTLRTCNLKGPQRGKIHGTGEGGERKRSGQNVGMSKKIWKKIKIK